jgi:ribonuclease HI
MKAVEGWLTFVTSSQIKFPSFCTRMARNLTILACASLRASVTLPSLHHRGLLKELLVHIGIPQLATCSNSTFHGTAQKKCILGTSDQSLRADDQAVRKQTYSEPKASPRPAFTVQNADFNRHASILLDEQYRNTIRVYADGSAHPDRAGSAAVLLRDGNDHRVLRLSLPADSEPRFTACDTEAVALLLGVHLLATERENLVPCSMSTDCKELIQAIGARTLPSSGLHVQRLLGEFYKQVDSLASINSHGSYSLQLCWVKGHFGVKGNVIAHKEARIAAMQRLSSPPDLLPPNLNRII